MSILGSIKFAEVAASAAKGNPSVSVRKNGVLVSNVLAEELVGANKEGKDLFKVGSDENNKIYLIPATANDANVIKATKNGAKFQFKQIEVFAALGAVPKNRYAVTREEEEGVEYFVLTPAGKSEEKEDEAPEA